MFPVPDFVLSSERRVEMSSKRFVFLPSSAMMRCFEMRPSGR